MTPTLTNFFWSLGMLTSLWGYGIWIGGKTTEKWTHPILGLAVFVAAGGWLDYTHAATRPNLTLLCLGGIGLAALRWKDLLAILKNSGTRELGIWAGAGTIAWLGSQNFQFNANWDDVSAYLPTCHERAESGNSWAPFSLRRALTWGGQFPLQSLGMLWTDDMAGYLYERALGSWLMAGIACGATKSWGTLGGWATGILMVALPQTNINSAPAVLVTAGICAAFSARRQPLLLGLLGAACVALRLQTIPLIGGIGLLALYETGKEERAFPWKWVGATGAVALMASAPFMLNHVRMFGTIMPLLGHGRIDGDYLTFEYSWKDTRENMWALLVRCAPPLIVLGIGMKQKETRMFCILAALAAVYITISMPEFSVVEWRRYSWAGLAAATIAVSRSLSERGMKYASLLAVVASISYPLGQLEAYQKKMAAEEANTLIWDRWETRKAQLDMIPEKAGLGILVLASNLMDFERNKIVNLDCFPSMEGIPEEPDPVAWQKWASANGIEFLMHTNFRGGERAIDKYLKPGGPDTDLKHYRRVYYPKRARAVECLESLQKYFPSDVRTAFVAVDLRNPPENPPKKEEKP